MSIDLYNLVIAAKLTKGGGGGGDIDVDSLTVTENGTYSASSGHAYSPVVVSVPTSGITPTGTKDISSNGIYDVTNFASASVSVPTGVFPTGTKNIVENGIYDVTNFASASVSVPSVSPSISALTVTENGTYSVPAGVDGYNPVTVSVSGGGGGDHDAEDGIIDRTISGAYVNNRVTTIGAYAFASCSNLTEVSCENVTMISSSAFYRAGLRKVSFPNVVTIQASAFFSCALIGIDTSGVVSFPNLETIQTYAFASINQMRYVTLPKIKSIYSNAFRSTAALSSLYILASSVPYLQAANAFGGTPLSDGTGKIYVLASLVDSYKSATNWSAYADRITSYVE